MNKVIIISCVVIGLFAVILALMEIGRRIGRRRKSQDPRGATAGLSAIDGAVCGFMGRLVAFAFGSSHPFRCAKTVNWSGSKCYRDGLPSD